MSDQSYFVYYEDDGAMHLATEPGESPVLNPGTEAIESNSSEALQAAPRQYAEPQEEEHPDSPIPDRVQKSKWNVSEIKSLLEVYTNFLHEMQGTLCKNDDVWKRISAELKTNGILRSASCCKFKFQHLKRQYTATKDHKSMTGVAPKMFKYHSEFEDIFGQDRDITPVALASSLDPNVSSDDCTEELGESASPVPSTSRKRRRETVPELLLKAYQTNQKSKEEREEKRLKLLQEQNATMKILADALEEGNRIHKMVMEKLLEKL